MRRSLIIFAASAVIAVAACSGSAATTAPTAAPATAAQPAAPATPGASTAASAAAGGGESVSIKNFSFNPASVNARVGDKVSWTNGDDTAHTVTFDDTSLQGSGPLNNGSTFDFTFAKPGTFTYHCRIHPTMKGTVTVA